jgi:transcriptional regulator with XRE-family HTH domain
MSKRNKNEKDWGLDFGLNLQRMIHRKGISQGTLASKLGSTDSMISRYIHGVAVPSVYKVKQMAEIIGCDISDLIKTNYDL